MSSPWVEYDEEIDELDREYYRSKLEELSRCLPIVRAAQALFKGYMEEDQTPDCWKSDTVLDHRLRELFKTVCALQAAKEVPR